MRSFQKSNPEKKDLIKALREGSIEIKVKVSYIEWPSFFDRFYKELINSIYSSFEKFYAIHWTELQMLFPDKYEKKDQFENNKLTRLLNYYFSITNRKPVISENVINIFNYYHKLRNDTVHPERATPKKTMESFKKIDAETTIQEFNFAPNSTESVSFDDYLVFSKVTKKICVELSDNISPSPENLISLIPKKFISDRENGKKKITEFFRREFGLDITESNTILDVLTTR